MRHELRRDSRQAGVGPDEPKRRSGRRRRNRHAAIAKADAVFAMLVLEGQPESTQMECANRIVFVPEGTMEWQVIEQ